MYWKPNSSRAQPQPWDKQGKLPPRGRFSSLSFKCYLIVSTPKHSIIYAMTFLHFWCAIDVPPADRILNFPVWKHHLAIYISNISYFIQYFTYATWLIPISRCHIPLQFW